jgi:hypothetical protein
MRKHLQVHSHPVGQFKTSISYQAARLGVPVHAAEKLGPAAKGKRQQTDRMKQRRHAWVSTPA